ncbi:hypothetical protein DM02DRAFT_657103 [Periconia macrospinosa]|uniref:Uncharacterized protein n=1 Tax=Periconia macrospinosa TaxID=97972 RepID=A0A2V1DKQ0_9PLEO|nr:hypothetical protein DM02DRAFT_657103 [Periconia macrospinosa]
MILPNLSPFRQSNTLQGRLIPYRHSSVSKAGAVTSTASLAASFETFYSHRHSAYTRSRTKTQRRTASCSVESTQIQKSEELRALSFRHIHARFTSPLWDFEVPGRSSVGNSYPTSDSHFYTVQSVHAVFKRTGTLYPLHAIWNFTEELKHAAVHPSALFFVQKSKTLFACVLDINVAQSEKIVLFCINPFEQQLVTIALRTLSIKAYTMLVSYGQETRNALLRGFDRPIDPWDAKASATSYLTTLLT